MNFGNDIISFFTYLFDNRDQILSLLLEHIRLTAIAVGLAILIGVPLGILISYVRKLGKPVLGVANVVQAIPSMALLGFAIPFLGIGTKPAVVMVVLYSLLPIVKNTYTGVEGISPQMLEAAAGIGMTRFQVLRKVRIPLALPVIMAGVRISAVTAVGLMTMAAFIGGGGLGYLVFSGIRTVDNNQILAGAIPACLLALFVDFLAGMIEKLVTPVSLQKADRSGKSPAKRNRSRKVILGVSAAALAVLFTVNGISGLVNSRNRKETITVGGKDFTEQVILTHLVSDMIESNTELSVNRKPMLGGTQVCFGAMKSGQIDLYIDYTGTCYGDTLNYPPISDMEKVYDTVRQDYKSRFNIDVLKQMKFNNTYTLAVKPETAEQYHLSTFSDLAKVSDKLVISPTLEFMNREDGFPGIVNAYGFRFRDAKGIDGSPRYTALMNNESDVVDAFSTDGLLKKFNLVVLQDDRHFFPPYYAVPLVRDEVLQKHPELEPVLEKLGNALTDDVMSELNYRVDELKQDPRKVAQDFLTEKGLIS